MDEGTTEVDDLKFALKWKPKQKEGVEPNKKCEANQKQSENSVMFDNVFLLSFCFNGSKTLAFYLTKWTTCVIKQKS